MMPASVNVAGQLSHPDRGEVPLQWRLAVEAAAAIRINGDECAVMMVTPQDLADLAVGFCLSEETLARATDIRDVAITEQDAGIIVDVQAAPSAVARQNLRLRRLAVRSGCGICGVQSLEQALRPRSPLTPRFGLTPGSVAAAFRALPRHQPINRDNRSVHAAAFCDPAGTILLVREDVGRHNALDKLIGAMARGGYEPADGFVVLTSRCSHELVQKASAVGISALATLSAPTTLALEFAARAGVRLACRCADGIAFLAPQLASDHE